MLASKHPELLNDRSITMSETKELAALNRKKYQDMIEKIASGQAAWQIEENPSLMISGTKQ